MADQFLETYRGADFSVLVNQAAQAISSAFTASLQQRHGDFVAAAKAGPSAAMQPGPWRANRSARPPEPALPPKAKSAAAASLSGGNVGAPSVPPLARPVSWSGVGSGVPSALTCASGAAVAISSMPKSIAAERHVTAAPPKAAPKADAAPAEETYVPLKRKMEEDAQEFANLKRRLRNSQRSGRNKVYYAMLNKYGPTVAAQYWVPPPEPSSSSKAPPKAVPKKAAPPATASVTKSGFVQSL
jgi:hypothetical protein